MRTLAIHVGGIGDFVSALPALAHLAEDGPLVIAGHRERAELAVAGGIAESVESLDAIDFHTAYSSPSDRFRASMRRFDRIRVWMRDHDCAIARAIRRGGVDDVRCWPGLPHADWNRRACDYYSQCAGLPIPGPAPRLRIVATDSCDVVIHPGSGSPQKNWPMERFVSLAARLERAGRHVAWLRGPAEEGIEYPPDATLLPETTVVDTAGIVASARLYVGNDSGISHVAAALGCPTLAVFGPTDPAVWAPVGDSVRIAVGDPWPSVGRVLASAEELAESC